MSFRELNQFTPVQTGGGWQRRFGVEKATHAGKQEWEFLFHEVRFGSAFAILGSGVLGLAGDQDACNSLMKGTSAPRSRPLEQSPPTALVAWQIASYQPSLLLYLLFF